MTSAVKKKSVVPIYKKGVKAEYSKFQGMSPLSMSYKVLSNILLLVPSPQFMYKVYIIFYNMFRLLMAVIR
jgi:hypothetical protein